ncbi:3-hydroxyacyl-CoA dehydrogenase family protein [candidate division CSSED10-310 bacterium]|uniref:3-hydroxyacyl-CoA dehydrogenase family protein n=1 Tax=candidate division CSSED10-310 bacterium TaxID=2855610 RepID=A0ABV6YY62_UNCC1
MTLDDKIKRVAVIGAGGKMGSGITLLLAQQMALAKLQPENRDEYYRLDAIDVNDRALEGLIKYIRGQALKVAEKTTVMLRSVYQDRADLVENSEIINEFVNDVAAVIRPSSNLDEVAGAHLVFEAILEKVDLKVNVLSKLKDLCGEDTYFFTNTSSIPIQELDDQVGLEGRIVGYHFYNPPAVQKLVELISNEKTRPDLVSVAQDIGKRLRKIIIPSNDVAGFIGNGHFIRDGLHALNEVTALQSEFGIPGAIYALNKVSQDLLIRPMGIFQLLDYVGIEVFQWIIDVMNKNIPGEAMQHELLERMIAKEIFGGQRPDGSQKDGFLKYEKNRPAGVYDLESGSYISFSDKQWVENIHTKLGTYPASLKPWKSLLMSPKKDEELRAYFNELKETQSLAAELAVKYLKRSKEIGEKLIADGVAATADDVNGVLLNGFFHLYGPVNDYVS